jgi:acetate kinase
MASRILTINGGSSSIKFALFETTPAPLRVLAGQVQRIGQPNASLSAEDAAGNSLGEQALGAADHAQAAHQLIDWLRAHFGGDALLGIGHRVVHGGVNLVDHRRITPQIVEELKATQPLDLAHLPREIALIETFGSQFPDIPQIACFDTAFHRELPTVARLLPIPREYARAGVRRFGFHGLSYAYLMEELRRLGGDEAANGRVILAHLGSGASMAAVKGGRPIDTTMAFTPTAGLVMGTRPGDLDPGVLVYLMRSEKLSPEQMDDLISKRCGLLGLSEISSDMRDLIARRPTDSRAAEAVDVFCYQARKWIGAYAAALGGLDTLVFAGGIGEHSTPVREEICRGLDFLGLQFDARANAAGADIISTPQSRVVARVIATDEEIMIARIVRQILANGLGAD